MYVLQVIQAGEQFSVECQKSDLFLFLYYL